MEKVASILAEELAKAGQVEVLTTNCGAKEAPRRERIRGLTIRRLRAFEVANLPVSPNMFLQCLKISSRSIIHVHVAQALIPEMVWISRWFRGGKFIAHFHLDVAPSGRFGRIFAWYKKIILGHTLRAAAKVIAFSADQANIIEKTYRVSADNVAVIPNGIGSEFSPKQGSDISRNRPLRVLYVGRLTKQKALHRLVHALAAMTQPVEALLVGEGDERAAIEDLVQRYGLENVRLPGRREGDELVATYQWADIFVLPSDREGMPLVALEAMASGLPVVATEVVGNRELLSGIGLLVKPDSKELTVALDRVARDEILRSQLARQSLAAAENYTVGRMAERLSKLYAEVNSSVFVS
jgi:glycosyltransferase involved in cell wall biosynthesis